MRLRYLILVLVLCAPPLFAQTYSEFITNRNVIADPDYSGKIPAAGVTFASLGGFSTPAKSILRVTDQNTCPAQVMNHMIASGDEANVFNQDGTRFITQTLNPGSSGIIPWNYNSSTMTATRLSYVAGIGRTGTNACESGTPTYLELFPGSAGTPTWGYTVANKDKLFVECCQSGQLILKYLDFTNLAGGYQPIKNISGCGAQFAISANWNDLTIDEGDLYLALPAIGGQDNATNALVVRISDGLCRYLNVNTMTVGGDFGSTGAASLTGPSGTCKIHNLRMDKAGKYVIISTAGCTGSITSGGRIMWDWQTLSVDTSCVKSGANGCGGHWATGYTHSLAADGNSSNGFDFRNAEKRTLPNSSVTYPVSPAFTGGLGASQDGYFSYNNANASDTTFPMWIGYIPNAVNSATPPVLRGEIAMLNGTGFIRIEKTCSSNNNLYNQGKAVVSQNGLIWLFVSNYAICNANLNRFDVFLTQPPTSGAPAPTIASLNVTSGTYLGGTAVTATGTNYVAGATLTFGGTIGTGCSIADAQHVTCSTPGHAAGVVDVVVTNPDAQLATLAASYTFNPPSPPAPTLSTVLPSTGTFFGQTPLYLVGTGFAQGMTITVGGTPCVNVSITSATTAFCLTGPRTTLGTFDVVIVNPDTQSATKAAAFTYTNVIQTGVPTPH